MSDFQNLSEKHYLFARKSIGDITHFEQLAGDASTRRYFRLKTESSSFILCVDTEANKSISSFLKIQSLFLLNEIRVPRVFAVDEDAGFMIIEDLGDIHLETYIFEKSKDDVISVYKKAIDALVQIQAIRGDNVIPFNLFFDVEKLMFEFDFFIEHFLKSYLGSQVNDKKSLELRASFEKIAEALQVSSAFVTTHRDYHSRNIIINNGEVSIIDFQDARMGLPQYDLVSLLEDPYVSLQEEIKQQLRDYYFKIALEKKIIQSDRAAFDRLYILMAYQRLVKALGTYGYMAAEKKKLNFIPYIEITTGNLNSFASKYSESENSWTLLKGLL